MAVPQIPGLVIEGELGRGAHSVVYRARQGDVPCALKLPRAKARWTRWIYREAVALARVKHRSLPLVLDVGEIDGLPYLVMELVVGETLATKLEEMGALQEEEAVLLIVQLASALEAVHDAGLVHRDVKPRNIVVEPDGSLKLVDFGFATPVERAGTEDAAGTAAYAAPEQLLPSGEVDGRSDLYGVGRVFFECLVGRSLRATQPGPTGAAARAALIARGISADVADVVAGLLRQRPGDRYPDARALRSDLTRVTGGLAPLGAAAYKHGPATPPLVARDGELGRILGAFRDVEAGGSTVVLVGSRGSGKSRLLQAVLGKIRLDARVVQATCRRDDPPLATLRRILEALPAGESVEELEQRTGHLADVARLITTRLGGGRVPEGVPAEGADSLAEGAAEIVLRLADAEQPLALLIDDAQWMDPVSRDALLRVAHRVGEARLVLIVAGRPESSCPLEAFSSTRRSITVELHRLSEDEVGVFVAAHLGEPEAAPALVRRVFAMADGTPLGVLEVLGALLDAGALRPSQRTWLFDAAMTDSVALPQGALVLFGHRLSDLPAATRSVLEAAAIIGTVFSEARLAAIVGVAAEDLAFALASARRAGLVGADERGHQHFVHDSLREMLVEGLSPSRACELHQTLAESLDGDDDPSFEHLCATANHYASGSIEMDPARVLVVARAAADAALARFDNATALRFYGQAELAAELARVRLEPKFFVNIGEAHLRLGVLDESLLAFASALEATNEARERASTLGRIAWVHQTRAEPDLAWDTLERAFSALGARMPVGTVFSAAAATVGLAQGALRSALLGRYEAGIVDVLCQLHYQNARLGLEYGKPARLLQSSLESLALSARGGTPRTRARARALFGFVLTALRRTERGGRELSAAREIARRDADAATVAFCAQVQSVAAAWAGDLDLALVLTRECVDIHGPWLEPNELCLDVGNADLILSIRGRSREAWPWIERGLERLRRSPTRSVFTEFVIHRARASLAAIGRDVTDDAWLTDEMAAVSPRDPGRGYHRLLSWGPRARFYAETADFGEPFEELVRSFEAEAHDPSAIHPIVSEYYVAVAHARMHQSIRAAEKARASTVPALRRAARDLRAAAKVPLLKAHACLAEGCLAWMEGQSSKATKLLADAEALARQQSCPWVLYGVARTRAQMLRAAGRIDAARDQARVAEALARDNGAVHRARWIREELGLTDHGPDRTPTIAVSSRSSSSRATRQLAALLQVARAPRRDLKAEQQAGVILDELISSLHADRGAIWFQPEAGTKGTAVARHRGSGISVSLEADSPRGALLRDVHQTGAPWPSEDGQEESAVDGRGFDEGHLLAVPLFLYDKPVGALCIEREGDELSFGPDDRALLLLLSYQVPIALEIARLLFEREQLHASLQQAKKMEAMGQLAGGLAHDFNNMIAAMKIALSAAQERATLDAELTVELDIISQATTRAAQLTSQLLSFSRHQPVPAAVHDVNQLIATLEPMLRRVVGSKVTITTSLSPAVDAVEVDQGSFDQALVNLLINARDAMPDGGTLSIATRNVVLGEALAQRNDVPPGEYVAVEITDTGEGMSADTIARIFEPFFTTKAPGSGSGLGLSMVYAFARNCGGSIDVSSEPGQGTQFRLYLKRVASSRSSRPVRPEVRRNSSAPLVRRDGPDTILVVDDDDLVRRSIAKILERNGYRVLAANGAVEALALAREQGARIALVILDVLMPGVTGPELSRRLTEIHLRAKVLYVSGFAPKSIPLEGAQVAAEMLLLKPFSQTTLLERVRDLMQS